MLKDDYKQKGERKKLIALLQQKGIYDQAVLAAMMEIPRHYFFTSTFQSHAYEDKAFPIGEGQTISQPYTVAFQTQVLHVKKGDKLSPIISPINANPYFFIIILCILLKIGLRKGRVKLFF